MVLLQATLVFLLFYGITTNLIMDKRTMAFWTVILAHSVFLKSQKHLLMHMVAMAEKQVILINLYTGAKQAALLLAGNRLFL